MNKLLKTLVFAATLTFSPLMANNGYVNDDILISAEEAIKLVGKKGVMFVSGDDPDVFKLGHIKGSVEMYAHHLHHSDITGYMHCEPLYQCIDEAEKYIGSKGIDNDTLVIAYDDFKGPNATGVYSFFHSYGHKNLKILNGGRNAIMEVDPAQIAYNKVQDELRDERDSIRDVRAKQRDAKQGKIELSDAEMAEVEKILADSAKKQKEIIAQLKEMENDLIVIKGAEKVTPKTYKIDKNNLNFSLIAGKDEVVKAFEDIREKGKDSNFVIIDSRAMSEIIGERKMDNVARGGHIPGSSFVEWSKISNLDEKLSFKDAEKLRSVYEKHGITPDKTIYAYCMVGAGRGSHHITALKLLGYENIKVFTGSWDVWGNDMNLPLKR